LREQRETFDLIERYLQGSLDQEEHARVEDRIKRDPAFAEEVELSAQVNSVVLGAAMDSLRERMTNDIASLDSKNKFKWGTAGMVVVLGIVSSAYLYVRDDQTETNNLKTNSQISSSVDNTGKSNHEIKRNSSAEPETIKPDSRMRAEAWKDTNLRVSEFLKQDPEEVLKEEEQKVKSTVKEPGHEHQINVIEKPKADKFKISFNPMVFPSCKGEATGRIEIGKEAIEGGTFPYVFTIDHLGIENSNGLFSGLKEGKHVISIQDKSGCSATQEVNLPGKPCILHKSFSINPDNGEIWKVPVSEGESGKFTIINKGGLVIFKGNFGNGELNEWNGSDLNGTTVNSGLYVCLLEYSSGEKETVQITIIR
jgi:hypothetical protein